MQVAAGVRIVQIFDSWGGELSPRDFESSPSRTSPAWCRRSRRRACRSSSSGPRCRASPLLRKTGADVLGCDWRIELDQARALAGPDVALQGNLDPLALFLPCCGARAAGGGHPPPRRPGGAHLQPGARHPAAHVTGRGEAPGRDGAPARLSRHRAADALALPRTGAAARPAAQPLARRTCLSHGCASREQERPAVRRLKAIACDASCDDDRRAPRILWRPRWNSAPWDVMVRPSPRSDSEP